MGRERMEEMFDWHIAAKSYENCFLEEVIQNFNNADTIKYNRLKFRNDQFLLDMGCGEGRHSIGALLETSANVVGLDLSLNDLNIAKSRLR